MYIYMYVYIYIYVCIHIYSIVFKKLCNLKINIKYTNTFSFLIEKVMDNASIFLIEGTIPLCYFGSSYCTFLLKNCPLNLFC